MGFFNRKKTNSEVPLGWDEVMEEVVEVVAEEVSLTELAEQEISPKFDRVFRDFPQPSNRARYMNLTSTYTLPIWHNQHASKVACWIQEDTLYFLSDKQGLVSTQELTSKKLYPGFIAPVLAVKIPISNIICFGSYQKVMLGKAYLQSLGYDVTRAVLGGIFSQVEGSTYALKKALDQLAENNETIEERKTVLYYLDEHHIFTYLPFNPMDFYTLQQLLPKKELKVFMAEKAQETEKMKEKPVEPVKPKETKDGVERLRMLRDLFDMDLITEEEYKEKRNDILKEL